MQRLYPSAPALTASGLALTLSYGAIAFAGLGPLLMGSAALATGSSRAAILVILALFLAGGVLLYFVDEREGARLAKGT